MVSKTRGVLHYRKDVIMKKSKVLLFVAAVIGIFAGGYLLLRFVKDLFDDYAEEDLFDEDTDLDFIDEDFEEEDDVPPVKEEKPAKAAAKVRRGYIPIRLHKGETAE